MRECVSPVRTIPATASPPTWSWRQWTWWSPAWCVWPPWSAAWAACCSSTLMAGRTSSTSGSTTSRPTSTLSAGVRCPDTSCSRLSEQVNTEVNVRGKGVWVRTGYDGGRSHPWIIVMQTETLIVCSVTIKKSISHRAEQPGKPSNVWTVCKPVSWETLAVLTFSLSSANQFSTDGFSIFFSWRWKKDAETICGLASC